MERGRERRRVLIQAHFDMKNPSYDFTFLITSVYYAISVQLNFR
jgi:hypothetical protein